MIVNLNHKHRSVLPAAIHFMLRSLAALLVFLGVTRQVFAQRQMEDLDRGLVAIDRGDGTVMVSWRLLADDPDDLAFHVYRRQEDGTWIRLTDSPLLDRTNFVDEDRDSPWPRFYQVRNVISGKETGETATVEVAKGQTHWVIPLQTLPGYTPNDASVGDLNGDGRYELVLKQEKRPRDNSQRGPTGQTLLEAYTFDGKFLWRINLGPNIREGAHYTPFLVYDFDGDGRAEVVCRTSDGTVDGTGQVIGSPSANHRNADGLVLTGPEYLTVFQGHTGKAVVSVPYVPPRGDVRAWGDDYGNRSDRFLTCVAYLDGRQPSVVMCRGYYTRTVLAAWNYRDGQLTLLWIFDSDAGPRENRKYRGQGNHNLSVADVNGDGRDEIIYGACVIGPDGQGLYSTELGHGDAMHVTDIDPHRPGLEIFSIHERPSHPFGANLRDAATGEIIWGLAARDVSRGLALDIDPRHPGLECWAVGPGLRGLFNCRGERIANRAPASCNMGVWWDGDLLREVLDRTQIQKWIPEREACDVLFDAARYGCTWNNGSKANPTLCADIFGDWREEVIWRSADNRSLHIFTTPLPSEHRLVTLMHDPVYRLGIAWQNVGYNQPAHPGFYLGHGMTPPRRAKIVTPKALGQSPDRPQTD